MNLAVVNTIFSTCVEKPEQFRTSTGLSQVTGSNPVKVLDFPCFSTQLLKIVFITSRIIASLDFISAVQYVIHLINHFAK